MKAWRDTTGDKSPARGAAAASDPQGETGRHRHGDLIHAHLEPHPHVRGKAGSPSVGIVGLGAAGTALGVAISRAGWPVVAVSSRDASRRQRFEGLVPRVRAFEDPAAVVDEAELVVLAVPDDVVGPVAGSLRLYAGQVMVHLSGLLGPEVLEPALAAGSQIGAFHPLVSFTSDVERSVQAIRGATIALQGDDRLVSLLADLADDLGAVPVTLPPGTKPAYHAAAMLASGGLVALLDAIATLGAVAGMDEKGALAVYGRLVEQTLGNARTIGVNAALTGPITRGDAGTLEAHLAALRRYAPDVVDLYLAAAERELKLAEARGVLSTEAVGRVRAALAKPA